MEKKIITTISQFNFDMDQVSGIQKDLSKTK